MWSPRSVEDLEGAVEGNAVVENEFFDFKDFSASSASANKEIAKDLAAMSLNGGVIVFGVHEDKERGEFTLAPADLKGQAERISQIALSRVQTGVRVTTSPLQRPDGVGYLVVRLAPSTRAPHMVDGRYYGRADTTNYHLSDTEVRTFIERNHQRRTDSYSLLAREIDRDLTPNAANARMMVLAQPISADDSLLLDASPGRNIGHWVRSLRSEPVIGQSAPYSPNFQHLSQEHRRANGMALSSHFVTSQRSISPEAKIPDSLTSLIDVEFREDGGIRAFFGRASDAAGDPPTQQLVVPAVIGVTSRVIHLARNVASATDFYGSWQFGLAIVHLRGVQSSIYAQSVFAFADRRYDEEQYGSVVEASYDDLHAANSTVLRSIAGRLVRALHEGDESNAEKYDEFPQPEGDQAASVADPG